MTVIGWLNRPTTDGRTLVEVTAADGLRPVLDQNGEYLGSTAITITGDEVAADVEPERDGCLPVPVLRDTVIDLPLDLDEGEVVPITGQVCAVRYVPAHLYPWRST